MTETRELERHQPPSPVELARRGSRAAGAGAAAGAICGAFFGAVAGAVIGVAAWSATVLSREAWQRFQDRRGS